MTCSSQLACPQERQKSKLHLIGAGWSRFIGLAIPDLHRRSARCGTGAASKASEKRALSLIWDTSHADSAARAATTDGSRWLRDHVPLSTQSITAPPPQNSRTVPRLGG